MIFGTNEALAFEGSVRLNRWAFGVRNPTFPLRNSIALEYVSEPFIKAGGPLLIARVRASK